MAKNGGLTRSERVRMATIMEHRAECQVSSRWLQFPQSAQTVGDASFMFIDVMTLNGDEQEKKICQLVLTKEDLREILTVSMSVTSIRKNAQFYLVRY